jgi:hypothetical protein
VCKREVERISCSRMARQLVAESDALPTARSWDLGLLVVHCGDGIVVVLDECDT